MRGVTRRRNCFVEREDRRRADLEWPVTGVTLLLSSSGFVWDNRNPWALTARIMGAGGS